MTADDVIQYEARVRPRQAAIAVAAAVLLFIAPVIGLTGVHTKVDELTLDLITIHKRFPLDLIAAVIQGFGLLALADTLGWLDARSLVRGSPPRRYIRWIVIVGAGAFAVGIIGNEIAASIAWRCSSRS